MVQTPDMSTPLELRVNRIHKVPEKLVVGRKLIWRFNSKLDWELHMRNFSHCNFLHFNPCWCCKIARCNCTQCTWNTWLIKCPHVSHHPTIRYMVYNGYYKVMSNIPKSWDSDTNPWNMRFMSCHITVRCDSSGGPRSYRDGKQKILGRRFSNNQSQARLIMSWWLEKKKIQSCENAVPIYCTRHMFYRSGDLSIEKKKTYKTCRSGSSVSLGLHLVFYVFFKGPNGLVSPSSVFFQVKLGRIMAHNGP